MEFSGFEALTADNDNDSRDKICEDTQDSTKDKMEVDDNEDDVLTLPIRDKLADTEDGDQTPDMDIDMEERLLNDDDGTEKATDALESDMGIEDGEQEQVITKKTDSSEDKSNAEGADTEPTEPTDKSGDDDKKKDNNKENHTNDEVDENLDTSWLLEDPIDREPTDKSDDDDKNDDDNTTDKPEDNKENQTDNKEEENLDTSQLLEDPIDREPIDDKNDDDNKRDKPEDNTVEENQTDDKEDDLDTSQLQEDPIDREPIDKSKDDDKNDDDNKTDKPEDNKENQTGDKGDESLDMSRLLEDPIDREVEANPIETSTAPQEEEDFVILEPEKGGTPKKVKPFKAATPRGKRKSVISPAVLVPFKHGWGRELVWRSTGNEDGKRNGDVYYFTPEGIKVRSTPGIVEHLKRTMSPLTQDNFTFVKDTIYKEPEETVRYAKGSRSGRKNSLSPMKQSQKAKGMKKVKVRNDQETRKKATPESKKPVSNGTAAPVVPAVTLASLITKTSPKTPPKSTTVVVKKSAVAKKKTAPKYQKPYSHKISVAPGKRPSDGEIRPVVVKKFKNSSGMETNIFSKDPENLQGPAVLCGLACAGQVGVPPTLLCDRCQCLFHPECVSYSGNGGTFVCMDCCGKNNNKPVSNIPDLHQLLSKPPVTSIKILPAASGGKTVTSASQLVKQLANSTTMGITPPPLRPAGMATRPHLNVTTAAAPLPPPTLTRAPLPQTSKLTVAGQQPSISGQLLTLPPNVASKLDAGSPLAVKMQGQSVVIPPNCFVNTPNGLKIFLPAGTLPVQNNANVPMNINFQAEKLLHQGKVPEKEKELETINVDIDEKSENKEKEDTTDSDKTVTERKSKRISSRKPCVFQTLHNGFDSMIHIFKYLSLKELLVASQVCRVWRNVAMQRVFWHHVKLRDMLITSWEKAVKFLCSVGTSKLDMRGMELPENTKSFWQMFTDEVDDLRMATHIDFCACPANAIHAVADRHSHLEGITALSITEDKISDTSKPANLNIGKFTQLVKLKELKLRGSYGIVMSPFSFNGGLTELGNLSNLRHLSLTSLQDVPDEEYSFLENLPELESLELGDCVSWSEQTVAMLNNLEDLKFLRLENGSTVGEANTWNSLKSLVRLERLELIRFHIGQGLAKVLPELKQVKRLSVWPYASNQGGQVNRNTLDAVTEMTFLQQLQWGVIGDQSGSHNGANNNISDEDQQKQAATPNGIPFVVPGEDGDMSPVTDYLTVKELREKLRTYLVEAKLIVFKVPAATSASLFRAS